MIKCLLRNENFRRKRIVGKFLLTFLSAKPSSEECNILHYSEEAPEETVIRQTSLPRNPQSSLVFEAKKITRNE